MRITYKRDDGAMVKVTEQEFEFWLEAVYGAARAGDIKTDIHEDADSTLESELAWEHRVMDGRILIWGELKEEDKEADYGRRY